MPKLAIAVNSGCHLILSAKVCIGNGSDAPDFDDLLYRAWRRARVAVVVADAGYDSEANHRIAREDMGVRSIISPGIGRPTSKPPTGRWRRHMAKRMMRKADQKHYGQRAQSETVHSMLKRNQGAAVRRRPSVRRCRCSAARNVRLVIRHQSPPTGRRLADENRRRTLKTDQRLP
jgi:hypothetical protein